MKKIYYFVLLMLGYLLIFLKGTEDYLKLPQGVLPSLLTLYLFICIYYSHFIVKIMWLITFISTVVGLYLKNIDQAFAWLVFFSWIALFFITLIIGTITILYKLLVKPKKPLIYQRALPTYRRPPVRYN